MNIYLNPQFNLLALTVLYPVAQITSPVNNVLFRSRVQQIIIAGRAYTTDAGGLKSYLLSYHIPGVMSGWTEIYKNDSGVEKGEGTNPETLHTWDTRTIQGARRLSQRYVSGRRSAVLNLKLLVTGNNQNTTEDVITITIRKARSARPTR